RGKSTSEKVFERLRTNAAYAAAGLTFVYYNFGCSGSAPRHIFSQPYDGVHDSSRVQNVSNQIPPQLNQVRALLGDTSTDAQSTTARTFLQNQHVEIPDISVPHIDAVYISTGGNDFGFGDVVENCAILPVPDCKADGDEGDRVHKGRTVLTDNGIPVPSPFPTVSFSGPPTGAQLDA